MSKIDVFSALIHRQDVHLQNSKYELFDDHFFVLFLQVFFFTNHLQICERRPDFVARVQRLIVSMLTDEDVPVRMQAQVKYRSLSEH